MIMKWSIGIFATLLFLLIIAAMAKM